jgi:hypothetical protein
MLPQRGSTITVDWTVESESGTEEVAWKAMVWDIHGDILTLFYEAFREHPPHVSYIQCSSATTLQDLDTQTCFLWAPSAEEASFSMAELQALTTQECDDYSEEACQQATRQWRRLTPEQRQLYAQGVQGLPQLAVQGDKD